MSEQEEMASDAPRATATNAVQCGDVATPFVLDLATHAFTITFFLRTFATIAIAMFVFAFWIVVTMQLAGEYFTNPVWVVAVVVSSIILLALLVMLAHRQRIIWAAQELRAADDHGGDVVLLHRYADGGKVALYENESEAFARHAARVGHVGRAYRLTTGRRPEPIVPITFTFEPRLLDQSLGDMGDLLAARSDPREAGDDATAPSGKSAATRSPESSLITYILRNREWLTWLVLIAILGALFVLRGPRFFAGPLLVVVLIAGLVRLTQPVLSFWRPEWFAVPGGVLLRSPRGMGTQSRLRLLLRENSLILATRRWNEAFWRVNIADATTVARRRMTNDELTLLLRAWSSTIEPPPLELLNEMVEA